MCMNIDRGGLRFFSETQSVLMESVLNQIIPSDDKYPGAGDLGLVVYICLLYTSDAADE